MLNRFLNFFADLDHNFRMIKIRSEEEIDLIRISSMLVAKVHGEVSKLIKPGTRLIDIDKVAEEFILDNGGKPAFKGYQAFGITHPFPSSLCMSLNETVVHGIPSEKELQDGDIISIDCGVEKNGYFGDSAYTYIVGEIDPEVRLLLDRTKTCLRLGIEQAIAGNRVGDISSAVQKYAESFGYGVVKELTGHGVGQALHEKPEVPNYGKAKRGAKLKAGMVLAIEPMINLGSKEVVSRENTWEVFAKDKKPSAHYEHTVVVRADKAEILSSFEFIEQEKN